MGADRIPTVVPAPPPDPLDVERRAAALLMRRDPAEVTANLCGAGVVVARAFLKLAPAGSHLPVDEEWLRAAGFRRLDGQAGPAGGPVLILQGPWGFCRCIELADGRWRVEAGDGPPATFLRAIPGNRQDVYDMVRLLGGELAAPGG